MVNWNEITDAIVFIDWANVYGWKIVLEKEFVAAELVNWLEKFRVYKKFAFSLELMLQVNHANLWQISRRLPQM